MIKDKLIASFLAEINEPAAILAFNSDSVELAAANSAYCNLIGATEKTILGADLFEIIAPRPKDAVKLWRELNKVNTSHPEGCLILSSYFNGLSSTADPNSAFQIKITLLEPHSKNTVFILQTVNKIAAEGATGDLENVRLNYRTDPKKNNLPDPEPEKKKPDPKIQPSRLADAAPDLICTLDGFGRFTSMNAASGPILGYPPESLTGKYLEDFLHIDDKATIKKVLNEIGDTLETRQFETRLKCFDGNFLPLLWSLRWEASEKMVFGVAKDGTESQLAQEKLRISEQRFKALVQDGSDLIGILNEQGDYLYVSPTSASVLGTSPDEYLGKNAFAFIHPDDQEAAIAGFQRLGKEHKVILSPFRFRHQDGSWRWIETIITDLTKDPAVMGIVANSRDITDRINAQNTLLRLNERYRFVSKATSDAIWDWDIENGKVYWGDGMRRLFLWESHQLVTDIGAWARLVHPDDLSRVEGKLALLLETTENQWSDEYRFKKGDGDFATVVDKAFVVRNEQGAAIRIVGAMQDVTRQRKEEHELKLLESVITQTSDLVMITDANHQDPTIIYVNEAFCQATGYKARELSGNSPRLLHGKKTDRKSLDRLQNCLQLGASCQLSVVNYRKNGKAFWNSYAINPVVDKDGVVTHFIYIGRDITELKNLQEQEKLMSWVSQIFNRKSSLVEAMEHTMKLLSRSRKYDYSEIWMIDHDSTHMSRTCRLVPSGDREDVALKSGHISRVKQSQGFAGTVWKTKRIQRGSIDIISGNFMEKENRSDGLIYSVCGIPLFYDKEIIGVLVFGSRRQKIRIDEETVLQRLGFHLGAEIRRKQLEQELGQVFDFAPDIIAISDFEGYFKKLNPAASTVTGYSTRELMSKPFADFLHPEDKKATLDTINAHKASGSVYFMEARYITKTGKLKWLAWTSQVMEDRKLIFSVGKDVTERKNLEDLLSRSNSLARVGSWEIDVIAGTVYWSDVTKEIREAEPGYQPDVATGISYFRNETDRETIRKKLDDCIAYGIPWDEELEILTFKGNAKWIRTIGQAEVLNGRCIRIFGSFQDIDTRKRAEIESHSVLRHLEESEKRYSELFHLSPLPMWVYDYETLKFLDVNQTAISHYGYSYEEFLTMTIKDIRPIEEVSAIEDAIRFTRKEGDQFYQGLFRHHKKNGAVIDVEIKSNIIHFNGRKAKVVVVNDITDQLKYFNAMKEQNKVLKEISWIQSHLVRAPLAKLMGLVSLLTKRSMQDEDKQQLLITNIELCAVELDKIIIEIIAKSENQEKLSRI